MVKKKKKKGVTLQLCSYVKRLFYSTNNLYDIQIEKESDVPVDKRVFQRLTDKMKQASLITEKINLNALFGKYKRN